MQALVECSARIGQAWMALGQAVQQVREVCFGIARAQGAMPLSCATQFQETASIWQAFLLRLS